MMKKMVAIITFCVLSVISFNNTVRAEPEILKETFVIYNYEITLEYNSYIDETLLFEGIDATMDIDTMTELIESNRIKYYPDESFSLEMNRIASGKRFISGTPKLKHVKYEWNKKLKYETKVLGHYDTSSQVAVAFLNVHKGRIQLQMRNSNGWFVKKEYKDGARAASYKTANEGVMGYGITPVWGFDSKVDFVVYIFD